MTRPTIAETVREIEMIDRKYEREGSPREYRECRWCHSAIISKPGQSAVCLSCHVNNASEPVRKPTATMRRNVAQQLIRHRYA
jgi:hypothetical protein